MTIKRQYGIEICSEMTKGNVNEKCKRCPHSLPHYRGKGCASNVCTKTSKECKCVAVPCSGTKMKAPEHSKFVVVEAEDGWSVGRYDWNWEEYLKVDGVDNWEDAETVAKHVNKAPIKRK